MSISIGINGLLKSLSIHLINLMLYITCFLSQTPKFNCRMILSFNRSTFMTESFRCLQKKLMIDSFLYKLSATRITKTRLLFLKILTLTNALSLTINHIFTDLMTINKYNLRNCSISISKVSMTRPITFQIKKSHLFF